jgi:hypothetical protein
MDPKILELRRLVVFEAIWGDETWRKAVDEALPVIEAQGARVAVLEAQNTEARERLEMRTQELKAERDQTLKDWQEYKATKDAWVKSLEETRDDLCDKLFAANESIREQRATEEGLRERLANLEEGNRELVRRAQQAEANERRQNGVILALRQSEADAKERARIAESRCALSAAGQVLSAVADRPGEPEENAPRDLVETVTVTGELAGTAPTLISKTKRYPCSPTCTHDDATKPGHPERVKERSEAVKAAMECPPSCPSHLNSGHTHQGNDPGGRMHGDYADGYDAGAEAMRAACWEAVQGVLERFGWGSGSECERAFKSAIEGAAP